MAVIVAVTPNPAIDVTYELPALTVGDVNRVGLVRHRAGGKGVNVARVVSQFGESPLVVAPVGGSAGDLFAAGLDSAGVAHRLVPIAGQTRRTTVVVTAGGETTGLYEPGPVMTAAEWRTLVTEVSSQADRARVVTIGGSLPRGVHAHGVAELVAAVQRSGAVVIADTSGEALVSAARAGADVLKPNQAELAEATGEADWRDGAHALLDAGAGAVLMSGGPDGLVWVSRAGTLRASGIPAQQGNTTGAGDAVVAAFAVGTVRGLPTELVLRRCLCAGAAAVNSPVAGQVDVADCDRFLPYARCEVLR